MKVKMLEYFQGSEVSAVLVRTKTEVNILTPDEVYEVNATLGAYLLENRKAELADADQKEKHYGGQTESGYPRNDVQAYEAMAAASAEEENVMTTPNVKKSRKGKGG